MNPFRQESGRRGRTWPSPTPPAPRLSTGPSPTRTPGGRMTQILLHELATQATPLLERLRAVLSAASGSTAHDLLARAVFEERATPRMVVTGQFSSGKSSLVQAL